MFVDHVSALIIEHTWFLKELTKMSYLLTKMWKGIRSFVYPHILAEKVSSLALEIKEKIPP